MRIVGKQEMGWGARCLHQVPKEASSKFTRVIRLDFHEAQCGVTTKTRSVDAVPGFFKGHIIRERYR